MTALRRAQPPQPPVPVLWGLVAVLYVLCVLQAGVLWRLVQGGLK